MLANALYSGDNLAVLKSSIAANMNVVRARQMMSIAFVGILFALSTNCTNAQAIPERPRLDQQQERSDGEMPQDQESYEAKIVVLQKFVTTPRDQSNPFRNKQIQAEIMEMRKSSMPPARVVDWICVVATVGRIFDKRSLPKGEVFCQTLSNDSFEIVTYRLIFDVVIPPPPAISKTENADNVKFLSSLSRGDTIVFTGTVPTEDIYALTSANLTNILMVTLFHEVTARKLHPAGETR
jgi:hypothetical protein